MSKVTVIPAGYRLTVESWENDADNYNTAVLEGLTEDQARFMANFAALFNSKNDYNSPGIGNIYEPNEAERSKVLETVVNFFHSGIVVALPGGWAPLTEGDLSDDDAFSDFFCELGCELSLTNTEFYTRVCSKIKVEYVPAEITLEDVTEKFVKG